MVKIIGILRLEYTLNYDEIKIRMLENVGRFDNLWYITTFVANDRWRVNSIVEYYIENRRIKDFDEQRRINGEMKRKRKMRGKCRIAITKKEKKYACD